MHIKKNRTAQTENKAKKLLIINSTIGDQSNIRRVCRKRIYKKIFSLTFVMKTIQIQCIYFLVD